MLEGRLLGGDAIMTSPSDRAMWRERMEATANSVQGNRPCYFVADWKCGLDCPAYTDGGPCEKGAAAYLEHDKEG